MNNISFRRAFNLYYRACFQLGEPCSHVVLFARQRMLGRA